MFGGLAFMVNGHMCCGIVGKDLVVRVGAEEHEQALSQPHAPMKGFVYVGPLGYRSTTALRNWIRHGLHFARSLPPK